MIKTAIYKFTMFKHQDND